MAWRAVSAVLALAYVGCTPSAPGGIYYASGKGSVTPDGLHLLEWEPFRITYVRPGADLARYDKVLVEEVTISYKTPPAPRQERLQQDDMELKDTVPNYALPDSAIQAMKQFFHAEFTRALGRSKYYSVVHTAGPDVLLVGGHIVNLRIDVPPLQDQLGQERVFSSSAGDMTLILDASDSQSGEALVRVGQTKRIELSDAGWYASNPVSNSSAVRQSFQRWADDLTRELDQFHTLPALPPVDPAAK
jgi:hypothetical protein